MNRIDRWHPSGSFFDPLSTFTGQLNSANSGSFRVDNGAFAGTNAAESLGGHPSVNTHSNFRAPYYQALTDDRLPYNSHLHSFPPAVSSGYDISGTTSTAISYDVVNPHLFSIQDSVFDGAYSNAIVNSIEFGIEKANINVPVEHDISFMPSIANTADFINDACSSTGAPMNNLTDPHGNLDFRSRPLGDKNVFAKNSDPEMRSSSMGPTVSSPGPTKKQGRNKPVVGSSRAQCRHCKKTFSRGTDLRRHAAKHLTEEPKYQCGVRGCGYGGSHRRDKVFSHLKNCHVNGRNIIGSLYLGRYCFPALGDCLFSQDFLDYKTNLRETDFFLSCLGGWEYFPFERLVTENGQGLKDTAAMLEARSLNNGKRMLGQLLFGDEWTPRVGGA